LRSTFGGAAISIFYKVIPAKSGIQKIKTGFRVKHGMTKMAVDKQVQQ
jgi:hypothetical protein